MPPPLLIAVPAVGTEPIPLWYEVFHPGEEHPHRPAPPAWSREQGAKLRAARLAKGLSQLAVACATGIPLVQIQDLEDGALTFATDADREQYRGALEGR